jgi:CRP-like cAMP-binding protein
MTTIDLFRNETDFTAVSPGATIFAAGDPGDEMYVILEGKVELLLRGRTIDTLGPGEVFGEMALIDSNPRAATAVASTACKLVPVSQKRFLFMVQQTPHFSLQIMKVIAERLRKMDARF